MKFTISAILVLQVFISSAETTITPTYPREGDNITVTVSELCLFNSFNPQGLTHLFEFNNSNNVELTMVTDDTVNCFPPRFPNYPFPLGSLQEGNYSIDVYLVDEDTILPATNRFLLSSLNIQVGSAPVLVNSLNSVSITMLLFAIMLTGKLFFNRKPR